MELFGVNLLEYPNDIKPERRYVLYSGVDQFSKWAAQKIWFVTRERENAYFHLTKVMLDKTKKQKAKGVLKEQYITVGVKQYVYFNDYVYNIHP